MIDRLCIIERNGELVARQIYFPSRLMIADIVRNRAALFSARSTIPVRGYPRFRFHVDYPSTIEFVN